MCNWITVLYTWNQHTTVNQVYFQFKKISLCWWLLENAKYKVVLEDYHHKVIGNYGKVSIFLRSL